MFKEYKPSNRTIFAGAWHAKCAATDDGVGEDGRRPGDGETTSGRVVQALPILPGAPTLF